MTYFLLRDYNTQPKKGTTLKPLGREAGSILGGFSSLQLDLVCSQVGDCKPFIFLGLGPENWWMLGSSWG